jgi:hypothetical protein
LNIHPIAPTDYAKQRKVSIRPSLPEWWPPAKLASAFRFRLQLLRQLANFIFDLGQPDYNARTGISRQELAFFLH